MTHSCGNKGFHRLRNHEKFFFLNFGIFWTHFIENELSNHGKPNSSPSNPISRDSGFDVVVVVAM